MKLLDIYPEIGGVESDGTLYKVLTTPGSKEGQEEVYGLPFFQVHDNKDAVLETEEDTNRKKCII